MKLDERIRNLGAILETNVDGKLAYLAMQQTLGKILGK